MLSWSLYIYQYVYYINLNYLVERRFLFYWFKYGCKLKIFYNWNVN